MGLIRPGAGIDEQASRLDAVPSPPRRTWLAPLLLFLGLAAAIAIAGGFYLAHQGAYDRAAAYKELKAISDLKADQLADWRRERIGYADFLFSDPALAEEAATLVSNPGAAEPRERLLATMAAVQEKFRFSRVLLVDRRQKVLLAVPAGKSWLGPTAVSFAARAAQAGQVMVSDLHASKMVPGNVDMDLFVPLLPQVPGTRRDTAATAVLVLEIDPRLFLFPLIQSWPTPSRTAETLLVRREGDEVVYLNELRHRKGAALTLRYPIRDQQNLPAALAVQGREGLMEGVDYRGAPVLAAARAVPNTPWFMVAKVDQEEIYEHLRTDAWTSGGILVALVLAAALAELILWQRIDARWLQRQLGIERERRELAARVAEEKERLLVTLRSIGDGVIVTDTRGGITLMNTVAETLTGWTLAEAAGRPLTEVFRIVNEQTRAPAENPVEKVLASGRAAGLANHTVLVHRDGSERAVADSGAPIRGAAGETVGVVLVFRDQTEERRVAKALHESEARHRALSQRQQAVLGAVPDIIMEVNASKVYTWANQAGQDFFGPDVLGKAADHYFLGEQDTYQVVQPLFDGSEDTIYVESWQRRRDGEKRLLAWWCRVLKDGEGRAPGALSTARDITEARQMEERLRQREKMEAIGLLAGGIAHDFNNQLAGIMGYAEMLVDRLDPGFLHGYAESILMAAHRAADLTRQLLAFARKGKYLSAPVNLHAVIGEVVALLQHSIDKRIAIKQVLCANPATTLGDQTQLQNALLNLALNARDAMPEGGELVFSTAVVALTEKSPNLEVEAGRYLQVCVSDTGTGMDAETRKHLFEPFFTTKEVGKGTGMGLASVFGTVRNHRGGIDVYSEPGRGTIVKIYLPLLVEAPPPATMAAAAVPPVQRPARILLVDDEPAILRMAAEMLRYFDHQVTTCKDGEEAVDRYREIWQRIDVVILDMVMPKLGGRDTFLAMRRINPGIKALLSSGYSLDDEAQSILDEGVLDFLQKPYRATELMTKVAAVLRGG